MNIRGRYISDYHQTWQENRYTGPLKTGKTTGKSPDYQTDDRIKVLLASSRRPVIAAGLTAMRNGAGDGLRKFLETCKVPVVVTPMAKGIIPSGHPCYAGVLFHALSDRLKKLTQEADLVIGLGYDPVEYNYESWLHRVPLVHLGYRGSRCFTGRCDAGRIRS